MLRTKLRRARRIKGWSQSKLAEVSGIAKSLIARYELGFQPSSKNLHRLCRAFEVSVDYFNGPLRDSSNDFFDDEQFSKKMNKFNRLSLRNKKIVDSALTHALYCQELEDTVEKCFRGIPEGSLEPTIDEPS
ncbi:MAG: helix-turn-helix transcriptional regulator [Cyclobacteriaceae bacterium]|nr:helix-turn-helix transcriptional regulator [Cyclobacteriaceae bacterium]